MEPYTAAKHRQPRFMDTHAMHMVPCRKGWQAGGIWVGLAEHRMQANVVHLRCSIACMLSQEVLLWPTMLLTSAPALCFDPKPDHSSCCQTTAPVDPAQVVTFASRAKSSSTSHKCPGCASPPKSSSRSRASQALQQAISDDLTATGRPCSQGPLHHARPSTALDTWYHAATGSSHAAAGCSPGRPHILAAPHLVCRLHPLQLFSVRGNFVPMSPSQGVGALRCADQHRAAGHGLRDLCIAQDPAHSQRCKTTTQLDLE